MRDLIVRHESFGTLLWSDRRHGYFIPRNEPTQRILTAVIDRKRRGEPWAAEVPPELYAELIEIGMDDPMREVHSPYEDRLSAPLEVYFDYTWACNLAREKCGQDSYCYAAEFLGPTTMTPERVRKILSELRDLGVMRLHLAGGEPTINRRGLANYLDTASALGLYTSMATNGMLFDEELCAIILRNHLKSVSFSLDGHDEETNARVRGLGVFARTVEGIRLFKRARDAAGSKTRICIKPTYEADAPHEVLEGLVQLGISLGVDVVKFANPERCLHHPKGHYGERVDAYYETIFFVQRLQERYRSQIQVTGISNPVNGCGRIGLPGLEGCIGAQELLTINPDGKITPCLMHPHDLGNVLTDYDSLRDFWSRSERLASFWRALAKPEGCNGCSIYEGCRSGSTTRRVVEVGAFNLNRTTGRFSHQKDPLCPVDYAKRHPHLRVLPPTPPASEGFGLDEVTVRHSL